MGRERGDRGCLVSQFKAARIFFSLQKSDQLSAPGERGGDLPALE